MKRKHKHSEKAVKNRLSQLGFTDAKQCLADAVIIPMFHFHVTNRGKDSAALTDRGVKSRGYILTELK